MCIYLFQQPGTEHTGKDGRMTKHSSPASAPAAINSDEQQQMSASQHSASTAEVICIY